MNRRIFLATLGASLAAQTSNPPDSVRNLKPMTDGVRPIAPAEREARIEKARRLMKANQLDAIYIESGTSMFYFTGKRAPGQAWLLPAKGDAAWLPAEPADLAKHLKDAGIVTGKLGMEEQVRFATVDGLRTASPAVEGVSATPVTAGCRM
ncbi:MAG: aminopeptidase P family N-terminal domain-containing protein, partial [Candidatus Solibacter sp.]